MSGGVNKMFQFTHFTMPNNISSTKYALKSFLRLADVVHGDGDGHRTPSRCLKGFSKSFK